MSGFPLPPGPDERARPRWGTHISPERVFAWTPKPEQLNIEVATDFPMFADHVLIFSADSKFKFLLSVRALRLALEEIEASTRMQINKEERHDT